ncbi:MAG: hypothetical protein JWM47_3526 [Acidimicrobiales bacterium]|nr:hypothetical protein [Acidimicrobiales bacterium]
MSPNQRTTTPSRRDVLRFGTLGAAGALVLAACGREDGPPTGLSGAPAPTTSVPPTVPTTVPSATAIENDAIQLRTLRSVELLVADAYADHGKDLEDPAMAAAATRFGAAHTEAAAQLGETIDARGEDDIVDPGKANEYLVEALVTPRAGELVDDRSILAFLHDLESTLAATYINAVGIFTTAELRQEAMRHGAADARRMTALASASGGEVPQDAIFSAVDLIPSAAYLAPPEAAPTGG